MRRPSPPTAHWYALGGRRQAVASMVKLDLAVDVHTMDLMAQATVD